MKTIALTLLQLEDMEHSLGIELWNPDWKKQHKTNYEAYRNYFTSCDTIPHLEKLVDIGFMTQKNLVGNITPCICYRVTQSGIEYLSKLLCLSIIYKE